MANKPCETLLRSSDYCLGKDRENSAATGMELVLRPKNK